LRSRNPLTRSLSWAAWHSKSGRTSHHITLRADPAARVRHAPASGRAANDREPPSPPERIGQFMNSSPRVPGSRRSAGSREHSDGMPPNLLVHYLYLWEIIAVRQAIEIARTSVSLGGHSPSYWYQQRRLSSIAASKPRASSVTVIGQSRCQSANRLSALSA